MTTYATFVRGAILVLGALGQVVALLCALLSAANGGGFLIAFILYLLVGTAWGLLVVMPAVLIISLIRWAVHA